MARDNMGAFSNVENTRRDKYEIKRRDRWYVIIFASAFVAMIGFALSRTKDFPMDFFLFDFTKIKSLDDLQKVSFRYEYYVIFVGVISILWYMFTREEKVLKDDSIIFKIGKVIFFPLNLIFSLYLKLAKWINPTRKDNKNETLWNLIWKIFYLPFNILLFHYNETRNFTFRPYWYAKIKNDFFKQVHNKTDELERVDELEALEDYHKIFTNEEYKDLLQMFRSEDSLIDYLKITEGYLKENEKEKYDKIFRSDNENILENFRAFDGKDTVYFSMDFIAYKTKQQSERYEEFLRRRFLKGRTRISAETIDMLKLIISDLNFEAKVCGMGDTDKQDLSKLSKARLAELKSRVERLKTAKEKQDTKYIEEVLVERLVIWFKFFFARILLQRYCNIPADLVVVKLADYSTRMIMEIYADKKLVNIVKNQNDGQSKSFEGDGLVNLFLYTWNSFLYGRKERVLERIEYNINTISDPADEEDSLVQKINEDMKAEIINYNKMLEEIENEKKEK